MDSDWAWLPPHLLDSVLEKIELLMDYLQFSAVCASWNSVAWNSVAKTNQSQNIKTLSHQAPMLLIPSEESNFHSIYDAIGNNFLKAKLVVPCDKRFAGSSHGWLVVVEKDFAVTLYKPYFMVEGENNTTKNTIIHLPSVFPSDSDQEAYADVFEDYIYKATITADPVTNPCQCTVMVIYSDYKKLAIIRPAKDKTWFFVDSIPSANEVLYCKDRYFALTMEGELYSFRIGDSFVSDAKLVASRPPLQLVGKSYLVESSEKKLLQVLRFTRWIRASEEGDETISERYRRWIRASEEDETISDEDEDEDETISDDDDTVVGRQTLLVIVYELDPNEGKWFEINSVGDLALFLGDNSSISVLASNFPGCKPNNIYFTHDRDLLESGHTCLNDIGAYDLESGRMELHFGGATSCAKRRLPIWILPTLHGY